MKLNTKAQKNNRVIKNLKDNSKYFTYSTLNNEDLEKELNTSFNNGLNDINLEQNISKYGLNSLVKEKKDSTFSQIVKAYCTPFSIILFFISILSGTLSYFFPDSNQEKNTFYITPLIIFIIIILSGTISYVQNKKSLKSSEGLKHMTENTSTVIRNGTFIELENSKLTIGDVIRLSSGDMLPADTRLIQAKDLFINQSALTGESEDIEKLVQNISSSKNLFDLTNIAYQGSSIVSGQGLAVIINIGKDTIFGNLASKIIEKKQKSSFQKGIDSIAKLLLTFILIMSPIIFIIDGLGLHFENGTLTLGLYNDLNNWLEAFVFAITVAIGIMPALLPMQVASNLAKGAYKMSKHEVIVKDIDSIQTFGQMDVLCTDKTGTLTENSSHLANYFNFEGENNTSILRLAFLNSYFQTGIKSSIDKAIINYGYLDQKLFNELIKDIKKIDEIPFDFQRKRLSVLLEDTKNERFIITKGSPESMLKIISEIKTGNGKRKITSSDINIINNKLKEEASKGRRTIIVASKDFKKDNFSVLEEKDMTFCGIICFEDPLKKSAKNAIKNLYNYGVDIKILTGDNLNSLLSASKNLNLKNLNSLSSEEIALLNDDELSKKVEETTLFYKLTPDDKLKIVSMLQKNKHTVGFMGDGINDAPSLKQADVGISFKDASDIAKESADIIMLENDLNILKQGIIEGRKSYINMMKYLKGQTSSNFGNMISQCIGAIWIPFLPMLAIHIILLDIITDISCSLIPFDNVDEKDIQKPLDFSTKQIRNFMFTFGPISSLVDMCTFACLFYFIIPNIFKSSYYSLAITGKLAFARYFQSGFFLESLITQNIVYTFLRTDRIPLIQSYPSITLSLGIIVSCLVGFFIIYVPQINTFFSLSIIPSIFLIFLLGFIVIYGLMTQLAKNLYKRRFKRLL